VDELSPSLKIIPEIIEGQYFLDVFIRRTELGDWSLLGEIGIASENRRKNLEKVVFFWVKFFRDRIVELKS
jgi:hypothetical protein